MFWSYRNIFSTPRKPPIHTPWQEYGLSLLKCALLYEVNQTQSHFGMHIYGLLTERGVSIHKHAKKEQDQYPAILTEEAWSINDLSFGSTP